MNNSFKCILRIKSENKFHYFVLYYCSLSSGLSLLVCGLFFLLREVTVLLKTCLIAQHVVKNYLIILIY